MFFASKVVDTYVFQCVLKIHVWIVDEVPVAHVNTVARRLAQNITGQRFLGHCMTTATSKC